MADVGRETPAEVWDRISNDAQKLCYLLSKWTITSSDIGFLQEMATDDFDLEKAMTELSQLDVLETVTFIQELQETVERLKPTRDLLAPAVRVTDEEGDYLRAKLNLQDYERDPARFKVWEEPRYRLRQDFKNYATGQFEE